MDTPPRSRVHYCLDQDAEVVDTPWAAVPALCDVGRGVSDVLFEVVEGDDDGVPEVLPWITDAIYLGEYARDDGKGASPACGSLPFGAPSGVAKAEEFFVGDVQDTEAMYDCDWSLGQQQCYVDRGDPEQQLCEVVGEGVLEVAQGGKPG